MSQPIDHTRLPDELEYLRTVSNALIIIAETMKDLVVQQYSTTIAINAIAMRLDPEFDPSDYKEEL
jgi:hypothetical protein